MTEKSDLKVVTVLDPIMCLKCRNAHVAQVLFTDGSKRKMFYCSRLDCDNWDSNMQPFEGSLERRESAA